MRSYVGTTCMTPLKFVKPIFENVALNILKINWTDLTGAFTLLMLAALEVYFLKWRRFHYVLVVRVYDIVNGFIMAGTIRLESNFKLCEVTFL